MNHRKHRLADLPPGTDDPLTAAVSGRDKSILDMVEGAIRHRQVMLAFQPIMQVHPPHGVAFYEGLIRVLDATGRVIPAREFIAAVEQTELGRELDCAALELGLRALAQDKTIRLSINMSARSIGYRKWMRTLDRALHNNRTIGERLILEISESSAMMVPELVVDFMAQLQKRGIAFALDDYGAGNIAIRHFREFLFDAVKIDGQFVRDLHQKPDNQILIASLIQVAHQFDMFTIAGSVESELDAQILADLGADCLQGYLYGAPTVRPPWVPERDRKRA